MIRWENRIAVFIDYDNIQINMETGSLEKFSVDLGWERFKNWLSSFGKIAFIFVFAPDNSVLINGEFFYKQGFIPISCPILIDRDRIKKRDRNDFDNILQGGTLKQERNTSTPTINTTDEIIIKTAEMVIENMPNITHICIASGDGDFLPIVRMAKKKKKKVMIMISSLRSASRDLLIGSNAYNGKKMVHLFNPIKD